ncbi:MAG: DegT/DnrJ/EryC1/StrS family aminotransferase [Verrucomicrobiae bacterium]|nr:DegT/DnrJ/EryC1/StrS family aminotransferase [Verrucomicrobiae bacterium]
MKSTTPAPPPKLVKRPRPPLGLGRVLIGKEEEELVLDVIRRKEPFRYYGCGATMPPMASTLEKEFREMMGAKHALAVTSGTAALEVALGALGIGPGDEVIVPAWSWDSCWTSVVRVGARPVLAEIDRTICLDPSEIARLKTPRTRAVMVIHYQGVAADMDPICAEARKAGLKVIEDCAESPGAIYRGKRVGSIGDIGTYSFQHSKSMTSGEGGMVVTNDPRFYERAVRMHDLGLFRPYHEGLLKPSEPRFSGSQFRMSELTAALALAQLRKLDGLRARCRAAQDRIMAKIRGLAGLEFRRIPDPSGDSAIEIYFWLKSPDMATRMVKALAEWNVPAVKTTGTNFHFLLDHCKTGRAHAPGASPFADFKEWPAAGYRPGDFPRSEDLMGRYVGVQVGVLYSEEDADYLGDAIRFVHDELKLGA